MKSDEIVNTTKLVRWRWATFALLAAAGIIAVEQTQAATNVVLWDTGARLGDALTLEDRPGWKAVPSELFVFEADPAKAASDPGYYGREYSFSGDAVVENHELTAVFWSAKGRVVVYSKGATNSGPGSKIFEFVPPQSNSASQKITRCEILRNAADEVMIEAFFAANGSPETSAVFDFGRSAIVEIKPAANMKRVSLVSPIEYGVVPGFIGDDLIFGAAADEPDAALSLPSENVFVGLLKGEGSEFVMTWPK